MLVGFIVIMFDLSDELKIGLLLSVFVVIYCSKNWREIGACQKRDNRWGRQRFIDLKNFASLFHMLIRVLNIVFSVIVLVEWSLIYLVFCLSLFIEICTSCFEKIVALFRPGSVLPMSQGVRGDNGGMMTSLAACLESLNLVASSQPVQIINSCEVDLELFHLAIESNYRSFCYIRVLDKCDQLIAIEEIVANFDEYLTVARFNDGSMSVKN